MNYFIICISVCLLYSLVACAEFDNANKKNLKKLVKQVMSDIEEIKQQMNDVVTSSDTMKTELNEAIQDMYDENALKMEEYKHTFTEWKETLKTKPDVLFLAKDPTTQSPAPGTRIVYGTTMYDTSQSYDNNTGIFTAPVKGSYAFSAQVCLTGLQAHTGRWILYAIVANGKRVSNSLNYDAGTRICNTAQAFVVLDKGQTAYVLAINRGTTAPLRVNHDHEWCTFTGSLIN